MLAERPCEAPSPDAGVGALFPHPCAEGGLTRLVLVQEILEAPYHPELSMEEDIIWFDFHVFTFVYRSTLSLSSSRLARQREFLHANRNVWGADRGGRAGKVGDP